MLLRFRFYRGTFDLYKKLLNSVSEPTKLLFNDNEFNELFVSNPSPIEFIVLGSSLQSVKLNDYNFALHK